MAYVSLVEIVPPAVQPITVSPCRQMARIDQIYDDNLIAMFIDSAVGTVESYLNRALITRTLRMTYAHTTRPPNYPEAYVLPPIVPFTLEYSILSYGHQIVELLKAPVQSVANVVRTDWHGNATTLVAGTDYEVDTLNEPARLKLYGSANFDARANDLIITYDAGYGANASSIPTRIIHALYLVVSASYAHRGYKADASILPDAARQLLDPHRLIQFP